LSDCTTTEKVVWTGESVKDFIWVMVYTGLRISDVGLFHMHRLKDNEVFLRAKKNGGDVFAYIPDWLKDRLLNKDPRLCLEEAEASDQR